MKKAVFMLVTVGIILSANVFSQEKIKFGDVSKEELESDSSGSDKEASAVVLYEEKETYYDFSSIGLFVVNDYVVRIKILSNDGLKYADGVITYYEGRTHADKEVISGLTGFTYNLENGKVVRTKLSKEHIFEEKISEVTTRIKFALPKVIPGSVIEYKYTLRSPHYGYLDDYVFQREIPVKYSKFTLRIPEYFRFNKEVRGGHTIGYKSSRENESAFIGQYNHTYISEKMVFEATDMPALRDEDYVWCANDFKTKVHFELSGIEIPGSVYKSFTNTWESVDKKLMEHEHFGKQFGHKLFKEEMKTLFTPEMSDIDKLRAIYNLVRSRIQPDDSQTLWAESPKNALKKGVGSSAEINAVLLSALKEAGFNAYPVVMSLRKKGRIPLTHPTIDYLNYFVACVDIDNKPIYMDASSRYGDLNVLPVGCLVDFARNMGSGRRAGWIDLSRLNQSTEQVIVTIAFNEDGYLSGNYKQTSNNQLAYTFRQYYGSKKDRQGYIDELQSSGNIQVSDFEIENLNETDKNISVTYSFIKNDAKLQDDFFYFNPLIFPVFGNNPFKAEHRELPVEFVYPKKVLQQIQIELPENYVVEELPKPGRIVLGENDAQLLYVLRYDETTHSLVVNMNFTMSKILFTVSEYSMLRDFFTHVSTQNNALIALKKKSGNESTQP